MSTTKIIKGFVYTTDAVPSLIRNGALTFYNRLEQYAEQPATLYIGTGKLWTEEEVRQLMLDYVREAENTRKDAEIEALRNPWISVKDRLPEEKTLVLAFVNYPDESRYHHVSFYLDGYWSGLQASFVTHWMPLPNPPKP